MGVIALLTDFGTRDHYVAQMKGVLLSECPDATILDITHDVEKFNVKEGAFVLAAAARFTPTGTIHVAVVDPGVGSERRPIVFRCVDAVFVGPDNGLMTLAAESRGLEDAYLIDVAALGSRNISNVFHGRDVFAPVACELYKGLAAEMIGPKIHDYAKSGLTRAVLEKGSSRAEVIHIDRFGNVITSARGDDLHRLGVEVGDRLRAKVGKRMITLTLVRAYAEARPGSAVALVGSHGFLEIGMNQGSASKRLGLRAGDGLIIRAR